MNNVSIFEQVLSKVNIIDIISKYIDVIRKGKNFWSICPFHNDSNPSMSISEEKQIYKCFSCGAGGDLISFVKNMDNLSSIDALKKIADISGIEVDIKNQNQNLKNKRSEHQLKIIEINNKASDFFSLCLKSENGQNAYKYLLKRGLDEKIIEKFKIGYAPDDNKLLKLVKTWDYKEIEIADSGLFYLRNDKLYDFFVNRITFAICDHESNTVGFSGRIYDQDDKRAKYSNSPETKVFKKSKILYNINNAKNNLAQNNEIILCEGFMDVIALYKAGFENVVATMGTSFGKNQINILKNYTNRLNIFMDSDEAGKKAAFAIASFAIKNGFDVKIVEGISDMDAFDIYKNLGKEKLKSIVKGSKKIFQYLIDNAFPKINKNNIEQIVEFKKFVSKLIYNHKNNDEVNIFKKLLKEKLGIEIDNIENKNKTSLQNINYSQYQSFKMNVVTPEQKALLIILKNKKAAELYKTKLNFLPTKIRRILASYIIKYWEKNSEFNNDTFSQLIKSNQNVYEEYIKIKKINSNIKYSKREIEDIIEKIKKTMIKKNKLRDLQEEMNLAQSQIEKAKILQKIHKISKG